MFAEAAAAARRTRAALGSVGDWLERRLLVVAGLATAVAVVVLFYVPVGVVLVEGVVRGGRLTADPVLAVLSDPFYLGVAAEVFADPLAVERHARAVAGYVAASLRPFDPAYYADALLDVLRHPLDPYRHLSAFVDWLHPGRPFLMGLFGFTAYQAALSTVASVALGLPGAYVLSRFEFRGRRALRSLTILPFIMPGIMVAIGFVAAFGVNGTFNDLLAALGFARIEFVGTLELVIVAHAFYNAPLVARVTTAAWEGVDASMVETARSLGAGRWAAFRHVVYPQLRPAVLTGALLTFIFTFLTFPIVLALGGLQLATVEVWVYDRLGDGYYAEAAALATVETVLSLGLTYAYLRYEARQSTSRRAARPQAREPLVPDWRALVEPKRLAIVAYGVVVLAVFALPIVGMITESLTGPGGVTLANYEFLLRRQVEGASYLIKPLPAVENSLLFGVTTVLVAVPMGVVVAALAAGEGRGRTALETLAMAPVAVSGLITGIGLLLGPVFGIPLWGGWELQATGRMAIVAAHAVAAYPFVVRNVKPQLGDLDGSLVESARALGASRARALVTIELPLVAAGVAAGAAFAFAISIGEFDSTVVLATGGDVYTMPVAVERLIGRDLGPATAMGVVLLAVTSLSFIAIDRLGGRYGG